MSISAFATLFTLIYSIWLFNRLIFGTVKFNYIKYFTDLQLWEFEILLYFTLLIVIAGLKPNYILEITSMSSINLLKFISLSI
jgi:NADH:ubiquinone oxidoreductase subunit 4 (subunit M)